MKPRKKPKAAKRPDHGAELQKTLKAAADERYVLKLYITGVTPKSTRAIQNVKRICEEHLKGRYILEIVDVYQQPEQAKSENIIAAPTLIKRLPAPLRKMIGDMANTERILIGLDLRPKE
jgi:circadian clock protein KaiB